MFSGCKKKLEYLDKDQQTQRKYANFTEKGCNSNQGSSCSETKALLTNSLCPLYNQCGKISSFCSFVLTKTPNERHLLNIAKFGVFGGVFFKATCKFFGFRQYRAYWHTKTCCTQIKLSVFKCSIIFQQNWISLFQVCPFYICWHKIIRIM